MLIYYIPLLTDRHGRMDRQGWPNNQTDSL